MPDRPRFAHRSSVALPLAGILLAALIALGWISIHLWTRQQQTQEQLRLSLATAQSQAGEDQATATAAHTTYQQQTDSLQATAAAANIYLPTLAAANNHLATLQAENANWQATAEAANSQVADQSRLAQANQLAVQALTLAEEDLPAAMLLSLEASQMADTATTRNSLLYFLQGNASLAAIWHGDFAPNDLEFSPDGHYLAAVHVHGQVILYDAATGRPIGEPLLGLDQSAAGDTVEGTHLAYNDSGRLIAAVKAWGEGNGMIVWDTTNHEVVAATDEYFAHFVAFWGEDQLITAGAGALILWNIQDGHFVEAARHEEAVYLFEPNPNGQTIAFTNNYGRVSFWNPTSGEVTHYTIGGSAPINSLAFNPEGTILAVGTSWVILWDVVASERLAELVPSQGAYGRVVEFSADGQWLMTASELIQLWDMTSLRPVGEPLQRWGYSQEFMDAALSPNGKMIVSSYLNGDLLFWEPTAETRLKHWEVPTDDRLRPVGFLEDQHTLVTYKIQEGTLAFWDARTGNKIMADRHFKYPDVQQYTFDREYKIAAAHVFTNGIGTTIVVDLQSNRITTELPDSGGRFMAFALNPEGTVLATRVEDTKIALWNTTTGEMIGVPIMEHNSHIAKMEFSPDGRLLATAADNQVFLWDATTWQLTSILEPAPTESLTFSPDGRLLATATTYGPITIWDTATGLLVRNLPSGEGSSIAFPQNGPILATSVWRVSTVYLWDRQTYQRIGEPFRWNAEPVLSSDGQFMATWYKYNTAVIWDMSLQSWQEQLCHVVNRNFTEFEWGYYFPNQPYRQTCPTLP